MAKIYVIDDDTALRTAYAAELSKLGHEIKTATDGNEGLELLKASKPDLILLDMLMPNLDGMGLLKKLRELKGGDKVKVIVVSNFESMPESDGLDVLKYLSKIQSPPDEVAAAVDAVLKSK